MSPFSTPTDTAGPDINNGELLLGLTIQSGAATGSATKLLEAFAPDALFGDFLTFIDLTIQQAEWLPHRVEDVTLPQSEFLKFWRSGPKACEDLILDYFTFISAKVRINQGYYIVSDKNREAIRATLAYGDSKIVMNPCHCPVSLRQIMWHIREGMVLVTVETAGERVEAGNLNLLRTKKLNRHLSFLNGRPYLGDVKFSATTLTGPTVATLPKTTDILDAMTVFTLEIAGMSTGTPA